MPAKQIFISYSRANRDFAQQLYTALQAENFTLWRDVHDIPPGDDWWRTIKEAIEGCDTMVLCMSLDALKSPVVSDEWNYARQLGRRVIPVIADEVFKHPDVLAKNFIVPAWMQRANWLDFRPGVPEREIAWQNLLNELRTPYKPRRASLTVRAAQLPHNYVPRPHELEPLVKNLVEPNAGAVAITAALRGAGGFGKTTLAKALCRDMRVSGAFDDGIFWITLGEALLTKSGEALENDLLARVLDLIYEITGEKPPITRLETAQEELAKAIGDRYILLVVDDVWHNAHLKPFLIKGKHCAVLITTRDDTTIPKDALCQQVDAMRVQDSLSLLASGIPENQQNIHRTELLKLADRLGNWPLLLGIVNGALIDRLARPNTALTDALDYINQRLTKRGLTTFDPDNPVERTEAVTHTLTASIERLNPKDQLRYHTLGIFAEDADVPLLHLQILWDLDELDTDDLCLKLMKASLLQDYDGKTIRLHDVIRQYTLSQLADTPAQHNRLIDSWGDPYALPDAFAWTWYIYHLREAGRDPAERLLDFRWLRAKLFATTPNLLLTDFDLVLSSPLQFGEGAGGEVNSAPVSHPVQSDVSASPRPEGEGQGVRVSNILPLLQSAVRLSLHVLALDPRQLPTQLNGRLAHHRAQPTIAQFLDSLEPDTFFPINPHPTHLPAGGALLRTLSGHSSYVNGALALNDGRFLSWSGDTSLRLWDAAGQPLAALLGHSYSVSGALALNDGRFLSWSTDNTPRLWDTSGQPLASLTGHSSAVKGAIALNDGRFLSWSDDHTLRLWSSDGSSLASLTGHSSAVFGAIPLNDGRFLSWSDDHTLRLWSSDGSSLTYLLGHTSYVSGAIPLNDGRFLSWSADHTLRLWANDGSPLTSLLGHTSYVSGAIPLNDGRFLSWSRDNTLRLWHASGRPLASLTGHTSYVYGAIALNDGRFLSWSDDNTLRLWANDGKPLASLQGHSHHVSGAIPLNDGRFLSWSRDNTLRLWSSDGSSLISLTGHTSYVSGAIALNDGRFLSWSDDNTLRLWANDGSSLTSLTGHSHYVYGAIPLNDGRFLSWSRDNTLRLWANDGSSLTSLTGHTSYVSGAIALNDGRFLSWSEDTSLRLWANDGSSLISLLGHSHYVYGAIPLNDGRFLSWSRDNTLRLWANDGSSLTSLLGHSHYVYGAIALNDGRFLSWSEDHTLRLWANDGSSLISLLGHSHSVYGAIALNDGRFLSWSLDNTLRLWANDGSPLISLLGHSIYVSGAIALNDGRFLSWSADNTLRLWANDGSPLLSLLGHSSSVFGAIALLDGRFLSWSADHTLRLWANDGSPLLSLLGHSGAVRGAVALPDGRFLSWAGGYGSTDTTLRLWDNDGQSLAAFYADFPITCCVLGQGGTIVAGDNVGRVLFLRLVE